MSATVGTFLREFDPDLSIELYERLDQVAMESSAAWNNAGTGHAGFAELNYTPERADGSIDIKKAISINESFLVSKQFWAYEVSQKHLTARDFIYPVPHISFVKGSENVDFLKKRFEALKQIPLFAGMEYSEDPQTIKKWAPLLLEGRDKKEKIAATSVSRGTDVNFGMLTRELINSLEKSPNTRVYLKHEIVNLKANQDKTWTVVVKNLFNNEE
ncbi:MAG: malate:quinone oxidoreductase, partial [Myxococcales bacterium]|nr:malate:quinone oxidoreductase [Myxococcales bacterium]